MKVKVLFAIYNLLLLGAAIFAIPWYGIKMVLTGKYRRSLGPKLGIADYRAIASDPGRPRIWVHAVSVGEVTAAAPIIREIYSLLPGACVVLSTSTETGRLMAEKLATGASLIYYPIDFWFICRKVLARVRPDVFVPVETEVWPNFILLCRKQGTHIVMVNGRLSPRSFARYRKTVFFWRGVFGSFDRAGMISAVDSRRIALLGVDPARTEIDGNAKYDGFAAAASPELKEQTARRLGVDDGRAILLAGSTHQGEESVIIEVYRRLRNEYPGFRLIVVPRHVERADAVAAEIRRNALVCRRMSEVIAGEKWANEEVLLVDLIGELFSLYSLATIVFCGGSLVARGGQNILEAAAWGKVVFHGPHMDDFGDEMKLLREAGAGITVRDGGELFAAIKGFLVDPELLAQRGEAGRRAVVRSRGASVRYAQLVAAALGKKGTAPCFRRE